MGIIAAGQITVVDLSDAPVLNTFITASRPTTQTYSKDSRTYKPSYASTPQVLTLKVTKAGSTANIIDSISSLHWFVVDGPIKTEITSKDNRANEYISGTHNEILTTKLDIDLNKGSKRYEVMGIWPDPSTGLDVQFGGYIDLLLTQNGATGPQGPQGDTGNGIANTVITYGLSMSDTTEPATWSSERPALVKGMYLWVRTVIIYTNGESTTSYQISYIAKDADATAEIDKAKQELLEKLETVRDDSLEAVDEAKQQLVIVRDESLAAAEEAKQGLINVNTKVDNAKEEIDKAKQDLTNVASELNTAKQDLADSVTAVNTKVDNTKAELTQAKQDLVNVASELNTAKQDLTDSVSAVNTKVDNTKAELTQAKQQLTTVSDDLSKAKTDFQNAVSAVDTKATNLKSDLAQAKQDLASQAHQLQEQASAQSELTNRVSSVEETANGTKTTVRELSKTVAQNGKDITSVTARTKVVEDDLAGTKTTLSQVQTTANTTSQKTATLETGLNGLSAKFDSLTVGGANLFKGSRDFSGSWVNGGAGVYAEDYKGVKIFKKQTMWGGLSQYFEVKTGEEYVFSAYVRSSAKTDRVTFYLIHSDKQPMSGGLVSFGPTNNRDFVDLDLTDKYQRIAIKIKITKDGWIAPRLERTNSDAYLFFGGYKLEHGNIATDYSPNEADLEQKVAEYKQNADQNYASLQTTVQNLDGTVQHNKTVADQTAQGFTTRIESLETYKDGETTRANQYFESARTETARQLTAERTAIAKDYVAKSTYTSDVTGIRNDLTATTTTANTTKTNLANYQASNDRAVANLQSNLQTANGNISSLKTKVEAVPGQITSAVSAVEGKIPTSVGSVNLFKGSRDFSGSWVNGGAGVYAEDYQGVKIFKRQNLWGGVSQYFEVKTGEEYVFSAYVKSSAKTDRISFYLNHSSKQPVAGGNVSFENADGRDSISFDLSDTYKRIAVKIKIVSTGWIMPRIERYNTDAYLFFGGYKLERGNVATDWSPAPEDTVEQISSLSSQIQQTADGMTLLATKTELNTAKNELQSGINTATNKANSAQSTANNNAQTINTHTTQISALNTGLQAKVSQTEFNTLSGRVTTAENNITAKANELSSKITSVEGKIPTSAGGRNLALDTSADWNNGKTSFSGINNESVVIYKIYNKGLKVGDKVNARIVIKYSNIVAVEGQTARILPQTEGNVTHWDSGVLNVGRAILPSGADDEVVLTATTKITENHLRNEYWNWRLRIDYVSSGCIRWKEAKVEVGDLPTPWSPAPEDTANQISNLSSEIKQTADGMTLLATKTELNNAKNELQSGITTATNKANNAQSTANSNAQTISTHTTQISALNTGLSAKVSQSDFNTLSGRVTTAENNITAKANELTSKITSVEGKIPTEIGAVNLFKGSRDFSGTNWIGSAGVYAEDYQGVKIFKKNSIWSGRSQYFEVKTGEEYVFSAYVKSSAKTDGVSFYLPHDSKQPQAGGVVSSGSTNSTNNVNISLTDKYKRIDIKIKITKDGWIAPRIERYNTDAYLFFGGYKLERGNVSTDWTPAPEDTVEQISSLSSQVQQTADGMTLLATKTEVNTAKNELQSGINTATNKANAAQNTANNAQNKANNNAQTINTHTTQISALNTGLQAKVSQTDFNTLSGRVTTAENNITAKANELTSKITSVEGKIPTSSGGRNLAQGTSKDWSKPFTGFSGKQNTCPSLYKVLTDGLVVGDTIKTRIVLKYTDVRPASGKTAEIWLQGAGNVTEWNSGAYPSGGGGRRSISGSGEIVFELTDKIIANHLKNSYWNLAFRTDWIASGSLQWRLAKVERGMFFTDWSPAPEDTISQIDAVSSELKQTADGMTLLATKTEVNTAKNELQSGINTATNKANAAQNTANNAQNKANSNAQTISTHTTQISALNTGLQAKVSQTDFNTLSGRVTTAENNITAKANELTSKITSVEGKIPTEIGAVNLFKGSRDFSGSWLNGGSGAYVEDYKGVKIFKKQTAWSGLSQYFEVKTGEEYVFSAYVKSSAKTDGVNFYLYHESKQPMATGLVSSGSVSGQNTIYFELTDKYKRIAIKIKITKDGWIMPRIERGNTNAYLFFGGYKLERGNVATDWTPAPEDTISQIDAVSSELKQTKDGITLLATKTELNNAKNDLQSGINTATNKANNAQNKANSNAQTISTHTTQISALNTGLQAKVSQTDFNTLSGRVTSAENNITAKANELTSKITSVEGKIPTSIGGRNLLAKTNQGKTKWSWNISSGGATAEDYNVDGVKAVKLSRTTNTSASWHYIQYQGLIRNLIEPNTKYTLSFDVKPNVDVTFSASLKRGDAGASLTNAANMNKALANKWTKVSCVLTSNTTLSSDTSQVVYLDGMPATNGNWLIIKNIKLEKGVVSSDWTPAPEDTISQVDAISSELKQTKDGITLLATKTELNTAKNELQSGINTATNKANAAQNTANNNAQTINTHTTQISALNTGLQAKVSQSEFNTLSGRVTTAENNITAKANELTSKITSVEGKIPTSVGSTNLLLHSADPWKAPSDYYQFNGVTKTDKTLNGSVVYKTNTAWNSLRLNLGKQLIDRRIVKIGEEFTYSVWMRTDQIPMKVMLFARYSGQSNAEALTSDITLTNDWQKFSVTFKITQKMVTSQTKLSWVGFEQTTNSENGKFVYYACNKLERGKIATDYSPAPEDAISQISSLSSELTQTKDGITLLATKTELNSAKNELQSGINTATNKANSNAQTISTHTNQISALNTGLSAKVSQSDFNTLSGRVTNAENNITAKANELSSKITSIEGKIPTEIGGVNLFKGSRDFSGSWMNAGGSVYAEDYKGVKIFKRQTMWGGLSQYFEVKTGEEYVFSAYVRSSAKTDAVNFYLVHDSKQPMATGRVEIGSDNRQDVVNIGLTDKYKRIAVKIKITKDGWIAPRIERYNSDHYLLFGGYKLERGTVATDWSPAPEDYDSKLAAAQSEFKQTTDSIKASVSSLDQSTIKSSSLTINSDGIVMKAGKTTTDVANAIGSYFAVNQNAINLFADKIKVKGNMIVAGSLTADMIAGGQLRSTNGATVFDLNGGTLTFNNNSGYIQRVAGDKIFEITTYLGKSLGDSQDFLTSDFTIRKSDNSRRAGVQFQLYNTLDNKPTATAKLNADSLTLYDSKNTRLFSVDGRSAYLGGFNMQGWGEIPVAQIHGGLVVKDIGLGGHMKSLLKIVEELCQKAGIMWI